MMGALTEKQYAEIMERIKEKHKFPDGIIGIKYIHPVFDLRFNTCFYIKFKYARAEKVFIHFDCLESMYDAINAWLDEEEEKYNNRPALNLR